MRDLQSINAVTAVFTVGFTAQLVLVDSHLTGGDKNYTAVKAEYGFCYLRNVKTEGYGKAVYSYNDCKGIAEMPYAYSSHGTCTLWDTPFDMALFDTADMPDPPEFSEDYTRFVSVKAFGAKGDGVTDDTAAIQATLDSGAYGVCFEQGCYLITKALTVGPETACIDLMFCDLLAGQGLAEDETAAVFRLAGGNQPLLICNLFAWESFHGVMTLVDHADNRTLVLRNLHAQGAAMYKNAVAGGIVFIENCACTVGGVPGAGMRSTPLPHENGFLSARHIPCFSFKKQTVYARQINPERSLVEVVNDGGSLVVLGYKTEEEGTAFKTLHGGVTQILGGICCIGGGKNLPILENIDSHCFAVLSTMITNVNQRFPLAVADTRDGQQKRLSDETLPKRAMLSYIIPGYIG